MRGISLLMLQQFNTRVGRATARAESRAHVVSSKAGQVPAKRLYNWDLLPNGEIVDLAACSVHTSDTTCSMIDS